MEAIKELIQFAANNEDDSKDYIKEVASTVKTTAPTGAFDKAFRQWVVAAVANLYETDKNTNPKCLILCGGQGMKKSSFWNQLCPSHSFCGHISLQNRDGLILLTDTFLIILDEQFETLKDKDWTDLKRLITIPKVRVRKYYQKSAKEYNRVASFCGTSNLLDKSIRSYNRRLISFELTEEVNINALRKIPIHKMWGQAYKLYQEGFLNQ